MQFEPDQCPITVQGWYGEVEQPFTMYNCNPNLICEGNFQCAEGYTDRMCAYCDAGHFKALERCYECMPTTTIIILLAIMYLGFLLLNIGITRGLETFNVLVNFCQLLSVINGFNTNWPNTISNLMNFASVLAFETDVLQPQCFNSSWAFGHNLVTQMLMPLCMAVFVALWLGFTYICYK